mmetsp:Transcript_4282/g.6516  ORF Transcript_4282/g.6516 Transcript_4282/m.6516 type:complete len:217 (+) Transcript_4282:3515-4165(+)
MLLVCIGFIIHISFIFPSTFVFSSLLFIFCGAVTRSLLIHTQRLALGLLHDLSINISGSWSTVSSPADFQRFHSLLHCCLCHLTTCPFLCLGLLSSSLSVRSAEVVKMGFKGSREELPPAILARHLMLVQDSTKFVLHYTVGGQDHVVLIDDIPVDTATISVEDKYFQGICLRARSNLFLPLHHCRRWTHHQGRSITRFLLFFPPWLSSDKQRDYL